MVGMCGYVCMCALRSCLSILFQFFPIAELTTEGAGSFRFPRKLALLKSTADTERIKRELRQFLIDKIGDTILVL